MGNSTDLTKEFIEQNLITKRSSLRVKVLNKFKITQSEQEIYCILHDLPYDYIKKYRYIDFKFGFDIFVNTENLNKENISKYVLKNGKLIKNSLSVFNLKEIEVYLIYHEMSIPRCSNSNCSNEVNFVSFSRGFHKFCSKKCSANSSETKKQRQLTNIEKYGDSEIFHTKNFNHKKEQTLKERYSVNHYSKTDEYKAKMKETCLERFGVESYMLTAEFREKSKESIKLKYNVGHYSKTDAYREKYLKTLKLNYGVTAPMQSEKIKSKTKAGLILKYNVDHYSKTDEYKAKMKETCLERFGVESYMLTDEFKEKSKESIYNKYGRYNTRNKLGNNLKYMNFREVSKEIILDKFIENDVLKSKEFKEYYKCQNSFMYRTLKSLDIKFKKQSYPEIELQKLIKGSITNSRSIISPLELDVYSKEHSFAIEYDGLMWHSFGKDKYSMFDNEHLEEKGKFSHLRKNELCENLGIKLFHVFENEWLDETKKKVWISIINSKQGLNTKSDAYSYQLKIPKEDEVKNFINENSLLNYKDSTFYFGLFEKDNLMFLINFDEVKDGEYEIYVKVHKNNSNILNAEERMLKYFIEAYSPKSLKIIQNRRWNSILDDLNLSHLGFKVEYTPPRCFYFTKGEYILKTEDSKSRRIWDSGNIVYHIIL